MSKLFIIFLLIHISFELKNTYDQFVDEIITKGVSDLGLSLHNPQQQDYIIYSPLSVASALYLLLLGASGQTYQELGQVLGVGYLNDSLRVHHEFADLLHEIKSNGPDAVVQYANGIFLNNDVSLKTNFVDISSILYEAEVQKFDFLRDGGFARDFINNWCKNKTQGKIQEVLKDVPNPESKIIVVNTLYFKAEWNTTFSSDLNTLQTFYPDGVGTPSDIKYTQMAHKGYFLWHQDSKCQIVGLPYKNLDYTFYVIIPQNSNRQILKNFIKNLNYDDLQRLISKTSLKEILVAIPKMKLTSNLQLNEILQKKGLRSLFSPYSADLSQLIDEEPEEEAFIFSRMAEKPKIYVNKILHQVELQINEIGTEAAATTSVFLSKSSVPTVKVNVPFMFFIQHKSGLMLFSGEVYKPPTYA